MKYLIVIDMQNDFINGSLGTNEAQKIVPLVKNKIELYRKNGNKIIFTRDTHNNDYLKTQEGEKLPIEHCIKNTEGWQISPILEICETDIIINKPTFGSTDLIKYLTDVDDIENIELIGLCTDICVISNALLLKAAFPEIPISVDANCCAGVTPQSHSNALEAMKMCQIDITE